MWLGKHPRDSESGKGIGIERGRESVRELAGHKGL